VAFWTMEAQCRLACWYQYFGGTYWYHLQVWSTLHSYKRTAVQLVPTNQTALSL